jgi:hypothetical protein
MARRSNISFAFAKAQRAFSAASHFFRGSLSPNGRAAGVCKSDSIETDLPRAPPPLWKASDMRTSIPPGVQSSSCNEMSVSVLSSVETPVCQVRHY